VLAAALKSHREASEKNTCNDFVFCRKDGSPLHPDVLRKDVLYPVLDRLRISRPLGASGFHAFRHSVGSLINAETGNLKLAQKLLGHSNINMTADVYTHTSQESEREAARVVERATTAICSPVVPRLGTGTKLRQQTKKGRAITRPATKRKKGASRFFLVAPMVAGVGFEPTTSGL
jgi:hypothetical protein